MPDVERNSTSADTCWKSGIVYQIYSPVPRQHGDGIDGIHAQLDFLVSLRIDAPWISPVYHSRMAGVGYDISDFCDIDRRFGILNRSMRWRFSSRGLR
jgi:alpha-glucosidase